MNKYTTIIVEDRKDNADFLQKVLQKHFPSITIAAICPSVEMAVEAIRKIKPDFILLDVQLCDGTGFDVLEELNEMRFKVVFVTEFEEYMLDALRASATDFLQKPYTVKQLIAAIDRVTEAINKTAALDVGQQLQNLLNQLQGGLLIKSTLHLRNMQGTHPVPVADVVYCKAEDNQTTFYLADKSKITVTQAISTFVEPLQPYQFVQVHRSFIVNLYQIKKYLHRSGDLIMKGYEGKVISVPREKKTWFEGLYENLNIIQ